MYINHASCEEESGRYRTNSKEGAFEEDIEEEPEEEEGEDEESDAE